MILNQYLTNELRIWSALNHPNILPLVGFTFTLEWKTENPALVSRWVNDISLKYLLETFDRIQALMVVSFFILDV